MKKLNLVPKIERLDQQPPREEVLPDITLLTDRRDVFSNKVLDSIGVSLARLRAAETDTDTFRAHLDYLTALELQAMLMPRAREVFVRTPLSEETAGLAWDTNVALFYICRAGLTMGLAAAHFLPPETPIGEFRIQRDEKTLEAVLKGYDLPPAEVMLGKKVLLFDPANATGGSLIETVEVINEVYLSRVQLDPRILIGNIVSAPFGVKELVNRIPDVEITTVALDDSLTGRNHPSFPPGYIVPGLGDAGDRSFGQGESAIYRRYEGMLRLFPSYQKPGRLIKDFEVKR